MYDTWCLSVSQEIPKIFNIPNILYIPYINTLPEIPMITWWLSVFHDIFRILILRHFQSSNMQKLEILDHKLAKL